MNHIRSKWTLTRGLNPVTFCNFDYSANSLSPCSATGSATGDSSTVIFSSIRHEPCLVRCANEGCWSEASLCIANWMCSTVQTHAFRKTTSFLALRYHTLFLFTAELGHNRRRESEELCNSLQTCQRKWRKDPPAKERGTIMKCPLRLDTAAF